MKLAIDASRANRQKKTGVEWAAWHSIAALVAYTSVQNDADEFLMYTQDEPQADMNDLHKWGNTIIKVLSWPPKLLWTHLRLSWQLWHDQPAATWVPAHVLPFLYTRNMVMTVHDVAFRRFSHIYSPLERIYQALTILWAKFVAREIITPSEFTKQELIDLYGVNAGRITVIPHGVDYDFFAQYNDDSATSKAVVQHVLDSHNIQQPYFLFVGRIEHKKNIIKLIEAFEQYSVEKSRSHQLVLVGKPGYGYEEIQQRIERSSCKDIIIQLGWVEYADLPALFHGANAFVYPTVYEGFGMPILEAYAAETPVITTEYGAAAEVAHDLSILVDPDSVTGIHIALHQAVNLRQNNEWWSKRREEAAVYAKKFTWERAAQAVYAVLKKAAQSK